MRVITGAVAPRRRSPIEDAYDVFRLERQGNLVSPRTLEFYDEQIGIFLGWLRSEAPEVEGIEEFRIDDLRRFRAHMAERRRRDGRLLQPETVQATHRALRTFLRWADDEGYAIDPRMLRLPPPRVPHKEATVYHIKELRTILGACRLPEEEIIVRVLVGSGVRLGELCGLALTGPDGLGDLMLDSLERGRAELRVRWDGGAKGRKARRVPITPQLALAVKRYVARNRRDSMSNGLIINTDGRQLTTTGVDQLMDRLRRRVGFRVHAHAFRHTFATVATQLGWNLERVRAAMGHSGYGVLQRYVCLSAERDLGPRASWQEFIAAP